MLRIGITGQPGFVGTHLYNTLGLFPDQYDRIPFEDRFFSDDALLRAFVKRCDVIVHLAAMNRHPDPRFLYETNVGLVKQLIGAMVTEGVRPHVLFSSSTQEELSNDYGASKRDGRRLLEDWAHAHGASFTGLVVPNVYGPFGLPNYNSFIATFAHKLTHGERPEVLQDSLVRLIYVGSLCRHILNSIGRVTSSPTPLIERDEVPFDFEGKVTDILSLFEVFKRDYFEKGIIPHLEGDNDLNLFNTFRSYIDHGCHYPVFLTQHSDSRGTFVETVRLCVGGQVSFSTTVPGVTRGNHYHTRKIERFTILRGHARVELRKIGTSDVLSFDLDGSRPSFVDTPVWYTHNLSNTGRDELLMQFWINEWYDPSDGDTYFETV